MPGYRFTMVDVVGATNLPKPFKRRRFAVVDLGSQGLRLAIGELTRDGWRKIPIGETSSLHVKWLSEVGQLDSQRQLQLADHIEQHIETARQFGVDSSKVFFFGTASMRDRDDRQTIVDVIERLGSQIQIVSGLNEALITIEAFKANAVDTRDGLFLDIGGRSTELVELSDGVPISVHSLKHGQNQTQISDFKGVSLHSDHELVIATRSTAGAIIAARNILAGKSDDWIGKLTVTEALDVANEATEPDNREQLRTVLGDRVESIQSQVQSFVPLLEHLGIDMIRATETRHRDGQLAVIANYLHQSPESWILNPPNMTGLNFSPGNSRTL